MKNLKIYSAITTKNVIEIVRELQGVKKMCIDTLNAITYFAIGNSRIIAIDRNKHISNVINLLMREMEIDDNNNLLRLDYLSDDQELCLIYEQGQVLTIDAEKKKIEKVCEFGKHIYGCAWSPDLQLLVIGTENQLFILSRVPNTQNGQRKFKILTEAPLRPTSCGKDQLVTIGWGSAESQFQGTAGKKNREKQNPDKIPTPIRSELDDKKILISWRTDGHYFTVSSVDEMFVPKQESPSKNISLEKFHSRQLRIWNRDLELMSHCEFLAGMEATLCMRPTGNLIAVSRVLKDERFIWFYERNGQYRSKFKLPNPPDIDDLISQTMLSYISWNFDSTILAVVFRDLKSGVNQLQFWTVSNYSWSEKLSLNIDEFVDMFWDAESMHKFHYVTIHGHYNQILLQFEYNCDETMALSINGDRIKVTDFKMATIPPPSCHTDLSLAFSRAPSSFVFSSKFGLASIACDYQQLTIFDLVDRKFVYRKNINLLPNSNLFYNLVWLGQNSIIALRNCMELDAVEIVNIKLDIGQIDVVQTLNTQIFAQFAVDNFPIWSIDQVDLDSFIIMHQIVKNLEGKKLLLLGGHNNIASEQFYQIKMLETEKETLLFTLTSTFLFFVNNKKLHLSIGSFYFSNAFLLLLTLDSHLHCIPIKTILNFFGDISENAAGKLFNSGRLVERGAQIIACEPNGTRVWLQMPRGNLEVISPRVMVLENLKKHLNEGLWERAFIEMRRHRVDINLIYDHSPKTFNDNLEQFISQIDNVDHLNLFLTSLQPNDSTLEMFASQYPERAQDRPRRLEGKINGICEKMRNLLLNIKDDKRKLHFYPVVLTTFLMERPSRISAALINMRDMLAQANGDSSPQMIQRWLRHLGYLINEQVLFKNAMKTYDIEIAFMVAQSTNLDPKEYLPILNDIRQKSPPAYQYFHIDLFLEDWPSALEHIAQLAIQEEQENSFYLEKCQEHIQQHNLHQQSLRLFSGKPHYKNICQIAAKASEERGFMKEAAILYEKAGDYTAAQLCLFKVQDFHGYLRLFKLAEQSTEKFENALKKMAVQLEHRDNFAQAAEILAYLGKETNAEKVLNCYSRAGEWSKFVSFVNETGGEYMINKAHVILSTRCTQIIEQIDEWRDTINKYMRRLEILRQEKALKMKQILEHPDHEDFNDGETTSQTSNISLKTRMSTATSRGKQNERKKQKIKEGSQWEDAAILVALKSIYANMNRQQDELIELMPALLSMDLIEKGKRLQNEMLDIVGFASNLIGKIWPDHVEPQHLPGPIAQIYRGSDNMIKWPTNGELMPSRVHLDDEIQRPKFNQTTHEWKLNIFQ